MEIEDTEVLWAMKINGGGFVLALAEAGFQIGHVTVLIPESPGLAQAHAVDN